MIDFGFVIRDLDLIKIHFYSPSIFLESDIIFDLTCQLFTLPLFCFLTNAKKHLLRLIFRTHQRTEYSNQFTLFSYSVPHLQSTFDNSSTIQKKLNFDKTLAGPPTTIFRTCEEIFFLKQQHFGIKLSFENLSTLCSGVASNLIAKSRYFIFFIETKIPARTFL